MTPEPITPFATVASDIPLTDPTVGRRHQRQRLICSAYLEVVGVRPILCIVRDLSEGGARLRVPIDMKVEGLIVLNAPDLGWRRPVRIVWNNRHTVGVAFEGPAVAS